MADQPGGQQLAGHHEKDAGQPARLAQQAGEEPHPQVLGRGKLLRRALLQDEARSQQERSRNPGDVVHALAPPPGARLARHPRRPRTRPDTLRQMSRTARLVTVALLNLALVAGLVVAGVAAHSVGVLTAGGDYLADTAALGVSLLAVILRHRPPTPRRPHGYPRATAYAALFNAALLLAVMALVVAEAVRRLAAGGPQVHGLPVLIASGAAALAMLGGGLILRGDEPGEEDSEGDRANMRAALLDTLADSAAAAGVAVTGAIILAWPGVSWLDPAVALVIALVIGYHAAMLTRDVLRALHHPADPVSL
jgi:cobalt-zinc-cadmium efflux system protein